MRISTAFSYYQKTLGLQNQQSDLSKLQQQIGAEKRILTPSDDSIGATRALETSQSLAVSNKYLNNITSAKQTLTEESTTLDAISQELASIRQVALDAGGSVDNQQQRTKLANHLTQVYQDLLGYANTTDSQGNHIFSGFKGNVAAFNGGVTPATYQGDTGQRSVAISASRSITVNDPGSTLFNSGTPQDTFAVINQFITDLNNTALTGSSYSTAVSNALTGITTAVDTVNNVHDQVALKVSQLDVASQAETNLNTQYKNRIDAIEGLDLQKAGVELQARIVTLQAAQQAFASTNKLSLFNYL